MFNASGCGKNVQEVSTQKQPGLSCAKLCKWTTEVYRLDGLEGRFLLGLDVHDARGSEVFGGALSGDTAGEAVAIEAHVSDARRLLVGQVGCDGLHVGDVLLAAHSAVGELARAARRLRCDVLVEG
eukprot:6187863-Pleurochrysis_carterae.AAC.2